MNYCDNCLHRYICDIHDNYRGDCPYFDDKSEYIHLPYRLGSVVWYIKGNGSSLIKSAEVLGMGIAKDGLVCLFLHDKNDKVFIKEADKVYPTYEEVERALKERDNNAE